jgi:hypothetical protein
MTINSLIDRSALALRVESGIQWQPGHSLVATFVAGSENML